MFGDDIVLEDFDRYDLAAALAEAKAATCERYHDVLVARRSAAADEEDETESRIFGFLAAITSFHFRPSNGQEPFGAMFAAGDRRSPTPDDFSDSDLDLLEQLILKIKDPELVARFGDTLWVRRRDADAARRAVDCYLASAESLFSAADWLASVERLERALRLSVQLGRASSAFKVATERVRALALETEIEGVSNLPYRLMDLLLEFDRSDPEELAGLAKEHAERAYEARNFPMERHFRRQYRDWAKELNQEDVARESAIRIAEAYVEEAELHDSFLAASLTKKAVRALQRIGGFETRITELRSRLPDLQSESLHELGAISTEVDVGELIETTEAAVTGKSWPDALFVLAGLAESPRYARVRERVEAEAREHPMPYFMPAQVLDEEGRIAAKIPPLLTADASERDTALEAAMCRRIDLDRSVIVSGVIEPARRRVLLEHRITETQLVDLIAPSPLVAYGHELSFARGLHAGLNGDFLTAGHLLPAQLEKGVREILDTRGVAVSSLREDGTQKVRSLEGLLSSPEAQTVFGEDIVFDLRSLLTLPVGSNLRNRVFHGLVHSGVFFTRDFSYLWWLSLKLCLLPLLAKRDQEAQSEISEPEADTASSH